MLMQIKVTTLDEIKIVPYMHEIANHPERAVFKPFIEKCKSTSQNPIRAIFGKKMRVKFRNVRPCSPCTIDKLYIDWPYNLLTRRSIARYKIG